MNNITLTSTLSKDKTKYEVSLEALANLTFDTDGPAPVVEVSECYQQLPDKTFVSRYEVSNVEPDLDLVESGAVWYLIGEANGNKVWLTLTAPTDKDEPEAETEEVVAYEEEYEVVEG
jgi:hypothetical protein